MGDLTTLRREVLFEPGYDGRDEGKGIHGMNIRFLLHGENGTVQFLIFTGWLPTHQPHNLIIHNPPHHPHNDVFFGPMAADLGYHWKTKRYDDQEPMKCEFLGECYYDGSGLRAEDVFKVLLTKGHEAVWEYLEKEYEYLDQ